MPDHFDVPLDQIANLRMVIGERCRVESDVTTDRVTTLTITTEKGIICTFKGEMKFTWVLPPDFVRPSNA